MKYGKISGRRGKIPLLTSGTHQSDSPSTGRLVDSTLLHDRKIDEVRARYLASGCIGTIEPRLCELLVLLCGIVGVLVVVLHPLPNVVWGMVNRRKLFSSFLFRDFVEFINEEFVVILTIARVENGERNNVKQLSHRSNLFQKQSSHQLNGRCLLVRCPL